MEITGDHERETLHANSYQVGAAFSFELADGRRTRAEVADRADTVARFSGMWRFAPPDPVTFRNVANVENTLGMPIPIPVPVSVNYRAGQGDRLIARTEDGCEWKLDAHGNTAELAPESQTCVQADGVLTRTFWSIASDGRQQTSAGASACCRYPGRAHRWGSGFTEITTKIYLACDGLDRPTSTALNAGNVNNGTIFVRVLAGIRMLSR
ncbi:hypothetical protein ACQP2U_24025 [Nocardia sp. CA-084685]|uniref:hypothetical protein n=1 Tax=Nocardia sp. CA-084685 TaxID=3239970 RepID=UPI003D9514CD